MQHIVRILIQVVLIDEVENFEFSFADRVTTVKQRAACQFCRLKNFPSELTWNIRSRNRVRWPASALLAIRRTSRTSSAVDA